jgi:hypothetical protein
MFFRGSVEGITGKVKAFVSGIETDTDVSSEVFHLEDPSTRPPPQCRLRG